MDIETINGMDWDMVSVRLDGTVLDENNDELDLTELESAVKAFADDVAKRLAKLRKMVAIATAN